MAAGQPNYDFVIISGLIVIFGQGAAQSIGGDAHDRILRRVEIGRPPQGFDGNGIGLYPIGTTLQGLSNNIAKKFSYLLRLGKIFRRANLSQGIQNVFSTSYRLLLNSQNATFIACRKAKRYKLTTLLDPPTPDDFEQRSAHMHIRIVVFERI
ncbi:hypothetical protein [Devosia elaeis]|uniref:hypothetical protein n=1 Tax=Devosia elaeis TaxID=1770058 RepID=UPI0010426736|nr:hypothetical protein [Devosia elaeis]